jgi:hypothetical protein
MSKELKEDFLSVDPPIPGQKFVCLSFLSPEKVLEDKHLYYMWNYERHLQRKIEELNEKLKESLNGADTGVEINKTEPCSFKQFKEMFLDFEYAQHNVIEEKFHELNDFRTTKRGLKVRGVYDTEREAEFRAKQLRNRDPSHHVFKGQVGTWLVWDPHPDDIENQEYAEDELNTLMKKKKENEINKNLHWEEEKRQKMEAIQRDNLRRKQENKRRELEGATNEDAVEGGATKEDQVESESTQEMLHTVSDDVKQGLVNDDPWLQRKLLEEAGASNTINDTALDDTINQLGGGACNT